MGWSSSPNLTSNSDHKTLNPSPHASNAIEYASWSRVHHRCIAIYIRARYQLQFWGQVAKSIPHLALLGRVLLKAEGWSHDPPCLTSKSCPCILEGCLVHKTHSKFSAPQLQGSKSNIYIILFILFETVKKCMHLAWRLKPRKSFISNEVIILWLTIWKSLGNVKVEFKWMYQFWLILINI